MRFAQYSILSSKFTLKCLLFTSASIYVHDYISWNWQSCRQPLIGQNMLLPLIWKYRTWIDLVYVQPRSQWYTWSPPGHLTKPHCQATVSITILYSVTVLQFTILKQQWKRTSQIFKNTCVRSFFTAVLKLLEYAYFYIQ